MRLRNVKNASADIEKSKYFLKEKEGNVFSNDNPLHVEIGCGKGDFAINMAIKYPNINFIAIEKYDSVLVRAIQKVEELNISNLYFMRIDAKEIEKYFNKEVDVLYLNFSDPWPKKRHSERRLTSKTFLDKYDSIFKGEKIIKMKTDNRKLFEFSLIEFVSKGYLFEDISLDLYNDDIKDNVPTEYETRFANMGNVIYQVSVKKD